MLNKDQFCADFSAKSIIHERLMLNVVEALKYFTSEKSIPCLDIYGRVKGVDSAWEKISRKGYDDPFGQIDDLCGVRVVCYYLSDIERICDLIRDEFVVESEEDTSARLGGKEFGYRSIHFIVKIKKSWLTAPQFRGLSTVKAEIQVRTVLMHAWAEIEHKLAYKGATQVPNEFRRKLYRLSAKFEEADEQFDDLRDGLEKYRDAVKQETFDNLNCFKEQSLNLDTLEVFLGAAYPDLVGTSAEVASMLEEIGDMQLSMGDLVDAVLKQKTYIEKYYDQTGKRSIWASVGALRGALDAHNEKYYQERFIGLGHVPIWVNDVNLARQLYSQVGAVENK